MDALKSEARKHVDLGDEHRMRHDAAAAGKEYRAALSMDPCSAYAWIGVGQAATDAARVDIAVKALQVGVRLAPSHYTAWTLLGRNYELMGQRALAAEAYGRALAQRPTLQEAQEGLARTR
jgi:predicted Zn-dependent protease